MMRFPTAKGYRRGKGATPTAISEELSTVVSELDLDRQNSAVIGRIVAHGGVECW
jgi:hypothetical protein